ncbi:hypothetical protein D8Z77_18035 [Brevibacillus laterosporus]|nr:hypothetical protein D8Z77_18035 [Brevibacillus laterosporus]
MPESSSKPVVLNFVNIRFYGQSLGELVDWVRIASGQEPQNKTMKPVEKICYNIETKMRSVFPLT